MSYPRMNWAVEQSGLLASEFRVLMILAYHENKKTKACFPSIETIAVETEVTERHCRKLIKQLERKGFIRSHPR